MAIDLPSIIAAIRPPAQEAIDGLLLGLGKDCHLVYPGKETFCPNCVWDPQAKRSSGRPRQGATQPFAFGTACPVCKALGKVGAAAEILAPVKLLIAWEPARWWVRPPQGVEVAAGSIQTKGFLGDVEAVLQSRVLIAETQIEALRKYRFVLDGEPVDPGNIIQGRYFVCTWKRAG